MVGHAVRFPLLFICTGGGDEALGDLHHAHRGFPVLLRVGVAHGDRPRRAVRLFAEHAHAAAHGHHRAVRAALRIGGHCRVAGCALPGRSQIDPHVVVFQRGGIFPHAQILVIHVGKEAIDGFLRGRLERVLVCREIPQLRDRQHGGVKDAARARGNLPAQREQGSCFRLDGDPFHAGVVVQPRHVGALHAPGNAVFQLRHRLQHRVGSRLCIFTVNRLLHNRAHGVAR